MCSSKKQTKKTLIVRTFNLRVGRGNQLVATANPCFLHPCSRLLSPLSLDASVLNEVWGGRESNEETRLCQAEKLIPQDTEPVNKTCARHWAGRSMTNNLQLSVESVMDREHQRVTRWTPSMHINDESLSHDQRFCDSITISQTH